MSNSGSYALPGVIVVDEDGTRRYVAARRVSMTQVVSHARYPQDMPVTYPQKSENGLSYDSDDEDDEHDDDDDDVSSDEEDGSGDDDEESSTSPHNTSGDGKHYFEHISKDAAEEEKIMAMPKLQRELLQIERTGAFNTPTAEPRERSVKDEEPIFNSDEHLPYPHSTLASSSVHDNSLHNKESLDHKASLSHKVEKPTRAGYRKEATKAAYIKDQAEIKAKKDEFDRRMQKIDEGRRGAQNLSVLFMEVKTQEARFDKKYADCNYGVEVSEIDEGEGREVLPATDPHEPRNEAGGGEEEEHGEVPGIEERESRTKRNYTEFTGDDGGSARQKEDREDHEHSPQNSPIPHSRSSLPSGWFEFIRRGTGQSHYWNHAGEATFERPTEPAPRYTSDDRDERHGIQLTIETTTSNSTVTATPSILPNRNETLTQQLLAENKSLRARLEELSVESPIVYRPKNDTMVFSQNFVDETEKFKTYIIRLWGGDMGTSSMGTSDHLMALFKTCNPCCAKFNVVENAPKPQNMQDKGPLTFGWVHFHSEEEQAKGVAVGEELGCTVKVMKHDSMYFHVHKDGETKNCKREKSAKRQKR